MFSTDQSGAAGHPGRLTAQDGDLLELAVLHGVRDIERPIAVVFSFVFNRSGARAALAELRTLGWPSRWLGSGGGDLRYAGPGQISQ